jgi:hypothetical protein
VHGRYAVPHASPFARDAGLRLLEVRDSYVREAFEWEQLERCTKEVKANLPRLALRWSQVATHAYLRRAHMRSGDAGLRSARLACWRTAQGVKVANTRIMRSFASASLAASLGGAAEDEVPASASAAAAEASSEDAAGSRGGAAARRDNAGGPDSAAAGLDEGGAAGGPSTGAGAAGEYS